MKKWFTSKHIFNGVFVAVLLAILLIPPAKAIVIRGLIEIGLFNPSPARNLTDIGHDLSAIRFKDIKGKEVSLADLKGKVIFLNFWATWCPPCLAEMPSIQRIYREEASEQFVFLLVDADSDLKKAQQYMDRKKFSLPVYEASGAVPEVLFNGSLPTTVILDKKGRIAYKGVGAANYASPKFRTFIKNLLAARD